ncbi:MAG: Cell division protein FtsI [Verrucomicrobiota bacterium]|jgi:cell division protein FtsI/penicillin-binding protein 2
MVTDQQRRRFRGIAIFLTVLFALLAAQLFNLQVLRHDELLVKARQNSQKQIPIAARRGNILDAHGQLLATSIFVKTVCADPSLLGSHYVEVARVVAPVLNVSEADLRQRLQPKCRTNEVGLFVTNQYVVLQKKVSAEKWATVSNALANLKFPEEQGKLTRKERKAFDDLRAKGIFTDPVDDQLRVYPNYALAAHVLGFTGMAERVVNSNRVSQLAGIEGIERTFDSKLAGVAGWRVIGTDRTRRELAALRDQEMEPSEGLNVVLTIDGVIQHIAEVALAEACAKYSPISATAIVMRPRTGEILAMATMPNFDPNNLAASSADTRRNRVIADVAEPGSTFKIVVVSGALNQHVVTLTDQFNCENGAFSFGGHVLHDHERYGVLSVKNIITKSSNIGAAKIGIQLGETELYDYMKEYGFGQRTGLPLPGEVNGLMYPPSKWSKVSIAQIPMGHGVAVTRMQMLSAMATIANNGWLVRPMIVSRLEDASGNLVAQYSPQRVRQVVTEKTARDMVEALKSVVSSEGTAEKAALEHYTVAGKTGTAQKAENGVYVAGKFLASFIGFFPADNPELCISVVLDEPKGAHYGGQTAAPAFKQIAERAANYLNIRPDRDDQTNAPPAALARTN